MSIAVLLWVSSIIVMQYNFLLFYSLRKPDYCEIVSNVSGIV